MAENNQANAPAQGDDFKIRPLGQYLRLTAEAARADHGPGGHMLCALTDYYLFENVMAIKPMLD